MTHKEKKQWAARRRDYLVRGPCAVCGCPPTEVHEILAGANRQAAFVEPACWLRVCRSCHGVVQGADAHYQLAIKLLSDPLQFDLAEFCKAWGRCNTAVEAGTVLWHVREILKDRVCR